MRDAHGRILPGHTLNPLGTIPKTSGAGRSPVAFEKLLRKEVLPKVAAILRTQPGQKAVVKSRRTRQVVWEMEVTRADWKWAADYTKHMTARAPELPLVPTEQPRVFFLPKPAPGTGGAAGSPREAGAET